MADLKDIDYTKDYYQILGITSSATEHEIKAAYLTLAKKYHPDKNKAPEALEKFKEVRKAYEILSDDNLKSVYDNYQVQKDNTNSYSYNQTNSYYNSGYYNSSSNSNPHTTGDYHKNRDFSDEYKNFGKAPNDTFFKYNPDVDGSYISCVTENDMAQLVKFFQASNNLTRWLNEFFWVFSSDMAWKFGDTEALLDDWIQEKYKIYTQLMLLSPDAFLDQETFKFTIQELFLNLIHNLSLRASQGTEHWLTKPQVFMPEEINWVYKPKVAIDWVWKKYKNFDWTKFYVGYNLYTDLGQSLLNIIYKYQGKDRTSHAYLASQRYFKEHQSQFEVPQKNWYFFNFYLMNNLYRGVTKASDLGVSNFNEYIVRIRRSQAGDKQSSLISKGKGWVGIVFGAIVVLVAIIIGIIAH